jgi:SAM-dependent methyltransferase
MSAESPHHHAGGYADFPFVQYVYDHLPAAKHRRDVDFHVEIAKQIGGEVLELAAGSGRIAIPTARAGVPITALDLSTYMLAALQESLARDHAADRSGRPALKQAVWKQRCGGRAF